MIRVACLVGLLAGCLDSKPLPPPCLDEGIADALLRNPDNGQCESFGPVCDPQCGQSCPELGIPAPPAWATCNGACESLTETQCLATSDCHAAYQDDSAASPVFWGCWDLPPTVAAHGSCANLDSQTCSEHDDCISLYTGPVNQPPNFVPSFESCADEPTGPCGGVTCDAGKLCVVTPTAPTATACEPTATAGACTGLTCTQPAPNCPSGTTPGIGASGCYTNYCIPDAECAAPACATLTTESACTARSDCDTVYDGSNCTCDDNGCTCQTETFLRCQ